MKISNSQFLSIEQLQDQYLNSTKVKTGNQSSQGLSFQEILSQKTDQVKSKLENSEVKFSKHAANRLADRNIELTKQQLERLADGTKKAGEKGINESLVIVDQLAFIVNIPSNTVITAMDQTQAEDNIYTNIDGAVII